MPASCTQKMDADLKSLLESQGVSAQIASHLTNIKCTSLFLFTNWATSPDETAKFLAKSQWKDDDAENARMRGAWKRAQAEETRLNKRRAEGVEDEALDEPFRKEVHEAMMLKYMTTYDIRDVRPNTIGSDTFIARVRKEFEAYLVQNFDFLKMKSQGEGRSSSRKTQRIAEKLEFHILGGEVDKEPDDGPSLWTYTERFRMAVTTWSAAGCYDVQFTPPGATAPITVRYCHQSDATDYMMEFFDQIADLRSVYSEGSIYLYLDDAEKRVREKAIALNRGRLKYPWGLALLQALRNTSNAWQLAEKHLRERPVKGKGRNRNPLPLVEWAPEPPQHRFSTPPPPPRFSKGLGKSKGKNKDKQRSGRTLFMTGNETSQGQVCKEYNDQRGCANTNCAKQHVCDVLLTSGRVCGKQHRRIEHNNQPHGQGQSR